MGGSEEQLALYMHCVELFGVWGMDMDRHWQLNQGPFSHHPLLDCQPSPPAKPSPPHSTASAITPAGLLRQQASVTAMCAMA